MSWETPVQNYQGPPLPNTKTGMVRGHPVNPANSKVGGWSSPQEMWDKFSSGLGGTLGDIFGIFSRSTEGGGAAQERAKTEGGTVAGAAAANAVDLPGKAADAARKGLGIDPASWQTFIRQTGADWGIYAGLGILGLVGLVFLVSAAGGGNINRPLSPYSAPQRIRRSLTGGGGGRRIGTMKK